MPGRIRSVVVSHPETAVRATMAKKMGLGRTARVTVGEEYTTPS